MARAFKKREYGAEQPYIPFGIFKIRIPGIHMGWTWPEFIQGLLLVSTPLSFAYQVAELFGFSPELGVFIAAALFIGYFLHIFLGDPIYAGGVTPALGLIVAYGYTFEAGVDRIHALLALQFAMAIVCLFFGVTGLAKKIMGVVPDSLRTGILMGAAISSIITVFNKQFVGHEISVSVGFIITGITMYSYHFKQAMNKSKILSFISKFGLVAGILVAYIVGIVVGELELPTNLMADGLLIPLARYPEFLKQATVFGVGFPPFRYFIKALPLVISAYLIAFGDFIFVEAIVEDGEKFRDDEHIDYNVNRSHIIVGLRNVLMGLFAPFPPLCGPSWGAPHVATYERYKHGRKAMDSIYDGLLPFIVSVFIGLMFQPVVKLFSPVLPVALGIAILVQAYSNSSIAWAIAKTKEERAVALLCGVTVAVKGAAWGLGVGIVFHLIMGVNKKQRDRMESAVAAVEREGQLEELAAFAGKTVEEFIAADPAGLNDAVDAMAEETSELKSIIEKSSKPTGKK